MGLFDFIDNFFWVPAKEVKSQGTTCARWEDNWLHRCRKKEREPAMHIGN